MGSNGNDVVDIVNKNWNEDGGIIWRNKME